ncbi:MAG: preprotein translocase subunit SecA [Saprospiraceae bacterium]
MFNFITKSLTKVFGNKYDRDVTEIMPIVDQINEEYAPLASLTNDELRNKTIEFRAHIADYLAEINEQIETIRTEATETENFAKKEELFEEVDKLIKDKDKQIEEVLADLLPEAFAVVKETARRFTENDVMVVTPTQHDRDMAAIAKKNYVSIDGDKAIWQTSWQAAGADISWKMVHYDVQLIGGVVLHQGKIAEMKTGEGKTLVATLPAYLNALAGEGVHVVTVNDYLARRDSEWIGPVMEFLFLTIDCLDYYKPHSDGRKAAYNCDITYGTNNEFGFDYLRDNMVRDLNDTVQGKHHFTMVDEIDSILIDDARTPLIISGPVPKGDDQEYQVLKPRIEYLFAQQRKISTKYLAEAKKLIAEGKTGHQEGEGGLALLRSHRAFPKNKPLIKFIGELGVKAILEKTENFYMQEQSKNMHLVDEPLLFTIEEKTRAVELTEHGAEFLAKDNEDPNFFIMPDIGAEILEISKSDLSDEEKATAKDKVVQDFALKSKRIHSTNQLLKAYTLFEKNEEYIVADGKVKIIDESTGRTMEGRRYSDGLHQALEAKESVKIEAATQTYATVTLQNYFRMYHKLCGMTGTAETEAGEFWEIYKLDVVVIPTNRPIARDDRQDLVFKTEREKFNAVIQEIMRLTAAGRPILVGTTSVEMSEQLSRVLDKNQIKHNVLNAKQHQREAEIIAEAGKPGQVTIATNMAGRGTDIKLSDEVKANGGLAIVGTERHDSRRVDRQLRGRAGRQGDPGSSQFFVSLEDNLMRLFHSERITKIMDSMGHQEGDVIQHKMVTKSIERAQKRVEENNFGIRKRLLEYDDVMNIQREAIYKRRYNALSGERLAVDLNNMFLDLAHELVISHKYNGNDFENFKFDSLIYFGVQPNFDAVDFKEGKEAALIEQFQLQVMESYKEKTSRIRNQVMPFMEMVHKDETKRYKYVAIDFTDGQKGLQISADLEKAIDSDGKNIVTDIEKSIALAIIDNSWKEHLRSMDELKTTVQAASFEQKDPLVIYKQEAYHLFEDFISGVNKEVVSFLSKGDIPVRTEEDVRQGQRPDNRRNRRSDSKTNTNRSAEPQAAGERKKPETRRRSEQKVGRNDACPCGSGKKYKQCHGKK